MLVLEAKPSTLQKDSFPVDFSGEDQLAVACQLWEEATDMLLQAGRILSQVKENTKRKFTKLISSAGLEKGPVNKLIKVSAITDEIPTVVARRLGVSMLSQLAQPKNRNILGTIEPSDNQISIAQKIKENRPPSKSASREGVRLIGKKGKLRIDIPGCQETTDIYKDFESSGLSPLEWLQSLCSKAQPTLKEAIENSSKGALARTMVELPGPWKVFPQQWQREGKNCSYDVVNGEKTICWGDFKTKITDGLAAKHINPRSFLDSELLQPGATVKIQVTSGDRAWNGFQAYIQEIGGNKAKVCLQGDDKEKVFKLNELKIVEPSPVNWSVVQSAFN